MNTPESINRTRPCPSCKSANQVDSQYCIHCGIYLADKPVTCSKCNSINRASNQYCIHCGTVLFPKATPERKRNRAKPFIIAGLCIFGLIMITSLISNLTPDSTDGGAQTPVKPTPTANDYPPTRWNNSGYQPADSVSCNSLYAIGTADSEIISVEHRQKIAGYNSGSCLGMGYTDYGAPKVITCEFDVGKRPMKWDCDW